MSKYTEDDDYTSGSFKRPDRLEQADNLRKEVKEEGFTVYPACPKPFTHPQLPEDDREAVARAMLNKWRIRQNQVEELYPHDKEAKILAEASILEILELMGVDI